jgi:hypothetical protein
MRTNDEVFHDRIIRTVNMMPIGARPQIDPNLENEETTPAEAPTFPNETPVPAGWTIENTSIITKYDSSTYDPSVTKPSAVFLNADASKLFMYSNTTHSFYEFDMSSADDIGSATLVDTHEFGVVKMSSFFVDSTGTKLFVSVNESGCGSIWRYSLASAWDFSDITYENRISIKGGGITDVFFSANGFRMFVSNDKNQVLRYEMSFPWNLNTAELSQTKGFGAWVTSGISGCVFNPDGSQLIILQDTPAKLFQFTVNTEWDLDTVTYDEYVGIITEDTKMNDAYVQGENSVYLVPNNQNELIQYVFVFPPVLTVLYGEDPPADDNGFTQSMTVVNNNILSPNYSQETPSEALSQIYTWDGSLHF